MKRTAEADKEESKEKIIKALTEAIFPMRWSTLLKETKLSSRTLTLRLKDLKKEGRVRRRINTSSSVYPPPVFYGLTHDAFKDQAVKRAVFQHEAVRRIQEWIIQGLGCPIKVEKGKAPRIYADIQTGRISEEKVIQTIAEAIIPVIFYTELKRKLTRGVDVQKWDLRIIQEAVKNFVIYDPERFKEILRRTYPRKIGELEKIDSEIEKKAGTN